VVGGAGLIVVSAAADAWKTGRRRLELDGRGVGGSHVADEQGDVGVVCGDDDADRVSGGLREQDARDQQEQRGGEDSSLHGSTSTTP
jgi:hypothetical protein